MKSAFIVAPGHNIKEAASFAKAQGIDGLELLFPGPSPDDFRDGDETRRVIDAHGLEIAAVGLGHVGLADRDTARAERVIRAGMDYASALGANCLFTGAGEPHPDDPVGALAAAYPRWADLAAERGIKLALYLGHKGSFIRSEALLAEACERVPDLGLKLDPVGIIRNLEADPYDVLLRYGANLIHFHVKDVLPLTDAELEPPPGLGTLRWGPIFAVLHHHSYDGYVSVEPHGALWSRPERRCTYIMLALRHVSQFMV
jgi:sugar phosphate isomerase/epimerase